MNERIIASQPLSETHTVQETYDMQDLLDIARAEGEGMTGQTSSQFCELRDGIEQIVQPAISGETRIPVIL